MTLPTRLFLILALALSGVLAGFYVWGEWVAITVILANAVRQTLLVRGRAKMGRARLVIMFVGTAMAGSLCVGMSYFLGMVMHGGAPS